jgi:thiamine-monophosphate kinase
MIDISDGLSSDLMHLCEESGTGCKVVVDTIPLHPETCRFAERLNISPVSAALNGGEDYELLFTLSPADQKHIGTIEGISVIGIMTEKEAGQLLELADGTTVKLVAGGWNAKSRWEGL